MTPRVKFGLIVGSIGLVLNLCVSFAWGICGPAIALLAGATAGFLAVHQEKALTKENGSRLGAIAGVIAGTLVLIGQLIGAVGHLAYVQFNGITRVFGAPPSLSADASRQVLYYGGGLSTGLCFGLLGITVAAIAGAAAGYFGTPDQTPS